MSRRQIIQLLILGCLILPSCRNGTRQRFVAKEFVVQDSLFAIQVDVPIELDTFYTWRHSSDNTCAHERKYRLSNSSYPIHKESGFVYKPYLDSCYQLTFSHVDQFDCQHPYDFVDLRQWAAGKEFAAREDSLEFKLYSVEDLQLAGQRFQLVAYKSEFEKGRKYPVTLVAGVTKIEGFEIRIEFACSAMNCEQLVPRMKESIKSIKLSKVKYDSVKDERELSELMTVISERCTKAGWLHNWEYILWHELSADSSDRRIDCVAEEDMKRLRDLSEETNAWIVWDREKGRKVIPIEMWKARYNADIKRDSNLLNLQ